MLDAIFLAGLLLQVPSQSPSSNEVRVLRAGIGPKGGVKGDTFVFDEERDVFNADTDTEIIVSFEWEGTPGTHRCEVSWIKPDGTVGLQSRLDLPAKGKRFTGYWSLSITPTMPAGLWAADVKVDGVASGSKTFRLQGGSGRPLPPDELYKLALEATITIEARLPPGAERRVFSGFAVGGNAVITTFGAVNAAQSLEIGFANGSRATTDEVWSSSRALDWILLKVPVPASQRKLALADAAKVGESCAFINVIEEQRQLASCTVVGQNNSAPIPRFSISARPTQAAFGAPLLNSAGHVMGLVGVDSRAGGWAFEEASPVAAYRVGMRVGWSALLVLPTKEIVAPTDPTAFFKLSSFWERGLFTKLVTASRHVGYGFLTVGGSNRDAVSLPGGGGEFLATDKLLTAVIQWTPREKLDTTIGFASFDSNNQIVLQAKPSKVSLRPGSSIDSSSKVDISKFKPGDYRLDVTLGDDVAWRAFFRIKP